MCCRVEPRLRCAVKGRTPKFLCWRVLLGFGNSANTEWDTQSVVELLGDALHHLCLERLDLSVPFWQTQ